MFVRSLAASLLVIFIAGILSSCSYNDDRNASTVQPEQNAATQWTVLFYGAGNTTDDILTDGRSKTTEIVHELQNVYTADQLHVAALVSNTATGNRCGFYEIKFFPGDADNTVSSAPLGDWGQADMSSPSVLQAFVDSATARFPAQHYMLVIGGSGMGWQGVCRDEQNGSGQPMPLAGLHDALQSALDGEGRTVHLDLVLWLAPGMSTMETAYELHDVANYMVAAPSAQQQAGFLAADQWLLDLTLAPDMSAERLGEFVVSRMQGRAEAAHDTLSSFALLNLSGITSLATAIDGLAEGLNNLLPEHAPDLLTLRQSLWSAATDDSSSVDLLALSEAVGSDSVLILGDDLFQAANAVRSAFQQTLTEYRTTRDAANRGGLMICLPVQPTETQLANYGALRFAQQHAEWTNLLTAIAEHGSSLLTIEGDAQWAGHALEDLYLFLNTAQTGAPVPAVTSPVAITNVMAQDHVEYQAAFALGEDSLMAYVGLFQDMDGNHELSAGDRYGYFHHNPTPLRDWMTIHSGDLLDSLHIELTVTR